MAKFALLRREMLGAGYTAAELSENVKMCAATMSHRLMGHTPFTLDEMYRILDVLGIKHELLHVYFPPDGEKPDACIPAQQLSPKEQRLIEAYNDNPDMQTAVNTLLGIERKGVRT